MLKLPDVLFVLRCLAGDTFLQARASGVFWLMLGVSAMCTLLCLSVRVEGDVPLRLDPHSPPDFLSRVEYARAVSAAADAALCGSAVESGVFPVPMALVSSEYRQIVAAHRDAVPVVRGRMTLAFGAIEVPLSRDREQAVHFLELQLTGWVADTAGLLLALIWTAGFLPTFLEANAVSVLLAKPVPRWCLLGLKYVGVLLFVGFQAVIFVGGTWLALGLCTGVWKIDYWLCVPLLLLHFGIFFSFSVLLAVVTRSAVSCIFGSILFWLVCWAVNFARHASRLSPDLQSAPGAARTLLDVGYWVLPKPADLGALLFYGLRADDYFARLLDFKLLESQGAFDPLLSVLSSLLFTALTLALAGYEFATADY